MRVGWLTAFRHGTAGPCYLWPMALRPLDHPDLSDYVVHLTGRARPRPDLDGQIRAMTAEERLRSILYDREIRAFTTFYAASPVVCFTESTVAGLTYLIAEHHYEPWGLVFDKQVVWDAGAGPALYVRGDEWHAAQQMEEALRARAVRYEPGRHEWVQEREWRLPVPPPGTGFRFERSQVHAMLVADFGWPPDEVHQRYDPRTGDSEPEHVVPEWAAGIPRWWWDATHRTLHEISHWPPRPTRGR